MDIEGMWNGWNGKGEIRLVIIQLSGEFLQEQRGDQAKQLWITYMSQKPSSPAIEIQRAGTHGKPNAVSGDDFLPLVFCLSMESKRYTFIRPSIIQRLWPRPAGVPKVEPSSRINLICENLGQSTSSSNINHDEKRRPLSENAIGQRCRQVLYTGHM